MATHISPLEWMATVDEFGEGVLPTVIELIQERENKRAGKQHNPRVRDEGAGPGARQTSG